MVHREMRPSRRDMLALGIGAFVVAAVPMARERRRLVRRSVPVMGTLAELVVVHRDEGYAHRALDAAVAELVRVDRLMSRFKSDSDVGRVNRLASRDGVAVSPETADVVRAALAWAAATDGAFDPSLARVTELWDVAHRHEPPREQVVRRLAHRRLYRAVDVDNRGGRPAVRLADHDAQLDLGGIAKGYGVDRAVEALRDWGITQAIVNVGGDLAALGRSEDGDPWRVGIRAPEDPSRLATHVDLEDAAIATSGDYLQYFDYGGRRYHHLMDPESAAPALARFHSVTVRADDCMTADAAATAAFVLRPEIAPQILKSRGGRPRLVHMI